MSVTIQDMARVLGLSHTTVSRVLNGRNDRFISQKTREKVWETARQLGYQPNRAARALVTGRTNQIALCMSSIYTSFHAQVINEVQKQIKGTGYQMMIASPGNDLNSLSQWQVDGYLVFEGGSRLQSLAASRPRTIPLVSMGGTNFYEDSIDYVGLDLAVGTDEALNHLQEIGCKRIAFVGPQWPVPETRQLQYELFVDRMGIKPEFIETPTQLRADARTAVCEYVEQYGCPDGLFCFNDDIAIGCSKALRDLGIDVSKDVAITGCDGIEDTEYLDVPLSTIVLPIPEMCRIAWEFFKKRIDEPNVAQQQTMLRPTLDIRASTLNKAFNYHSL